MIFTSLLGTRLAGIKTGSSCQLEPAVAAGACWVVGGAKLVLGATVYLGFFTGGASTGFAVERLRVAVVVAGWDAWCEYERCKVRGCRMFLHTYYK